MVNFFCGVHFIDVKSTLLSWLPFKVPKVFKNYRALKSTKRIPKVRYINGVLLRVTRVFRKYKEDFSTDFGTPRCVFVPLTPALLVSGLLRVLFLVLRVEVAAPHVSPITSWRTSWLTSRRSKRDQHPGLLLLSAY